MGEGELDQIRLQNQGQDPHHIQGQDQDQEIVEVFHKRNLSLILSKKGLLENWIT